MSSHSSIRTKDVIDALDRYGHAIVLILTVLTLTGIMTYFIPAHIDLGSIEVGRESNRTVRAPRDFLIEDHSTTDRRRAEAAALVPKVFIFDDRSVQLVERQLEEVQTQLIASELQNPLLNMPSEVQSQASFAAFESTSRFGLQRVEWDILRRSDRWPSVKERVTALLAPILDRGVVTDKKSLDKSVNQTGVLLHFTSGRIDERIGSRSSMVSTRQAAELLRQQGAEVVQGPTDAFDSLCLKLASGLLRPNVHFDLVRTERAMLVTRQAVDPLFSRIRRGELIVRSGDVVTSIQDHKLRQLESVLSQYSQIGSSTGYALFCLVALVSVTVFARALWSDFGKSYRDLSVIALTLVGSLILIKIHLVLAHSLSESFPEVDSNSFLLAAPLAVGGMLLQVVLGPPAVFVFLLSLGLLTGIFLEQPWVMLAFITLGNIVGAVSVRWCNRRSVFILAGMKVALLNAGLVACFYLLFPDHGLADASGRVLSAVAGGLFSSVLAAGLLPVAEWLGGHVTNIKMLELASLDRPLLRELSLHAPGTWNHSMNIGQMAEAAAEAIGANGLLARVGSYYHDIGKMKKPQYFAENQTDRDNRHDRLTPSMSALIIKAHVKDGAEMARQAGIPKAIIDFIPEHHGTSLIEYFYEKAKRESDEGDSVDEGHYRYGGPKPQSKETGILMLADGIESAARTISDPTIARIQGLVQKMINKVFASGQLDESNLTLKDLHVIAKVFTRVLSGILHRRVEYYEPAEKVRNTGPKRVEQEEHVRLVQSGKVAELKRDGSRNSSETTGTHIAADGTDEVPPPPSGKDTLKRLGMQGS